MAPVPPVASNSPENAVPHQIPAADSDGHGVAVEDSAGEVTTFHVKMQVGLARAPGVADLRKRISGADGLAAPDRDGDVLLDGGHGQFGVDYALSAEDVAYYRRYLEGQGIGLDQRNRLSDAYLAGGRALLVTTPVGPFGAGECERIRAFRDDGGAVILLGDATAPAFARQSLNDLAAALGSDLRLNADRVRDPTSNLDGDPTLPTTTAFDDDGPLFEPFDGAPGNE